MPATQSVTEHPGLPFRRDIEGMRALAVLLVVAAHAGIPWLQGGYIGVDVFFVISGYLITGLLHREIEQTGRIDLLSFYGRRLLRLFPALVLVIAVTCVAAAILLAPFEHRAQAYAALGAITWTSNLQFAFEDVGYFDLGSQDNLFLHTWSLGVEEQFYLLWPLLLLFAMRAAGRASPRRGRLTLLIIAAVAVISLGACVYLTGVEPKLAFYMVFTRAWQFALGAFGWLLAPAIATGAHVAARAFRRLGAVWATMGVAAIIGCAVAYGHGEPYPGWRAVMPSFATAVVLACGALPAGNPVTRLLSLPPMVGIGGLSYAWYLWHWPAIVLSRGIDGVQTTSASAAAVVVSLVLAWMTKRLLEDPARRQLRQRPRSVIAGAMAGMALVAVFAFGWRSAADRWQALPSQQRFADARQDGAVIYAFDCDQGNRSWRVQLCELGARQDRSPVVLLGDSIAMQWLPAVVARHPDRQVIAVTKSACPMVDAPFFYARIGRPYVECELWREAVLQTLARMRPGVVYVGSGSAYPFGLGQWREGATRIMRRIVEASPDTYLLEPAPVLGFDGPRCLAREAWQARLLPASECTAAADPRRDEVVDALRTAARLAGAKPIDLADLACSDGHCVAFRDGRVIFRDAVHLANSYVESRASGFSAAVDRAAHP